MSPPDFFNRKAGRIRLSLAGAALALEPRERRQHFGSSSASRSARSRETFRRWRGGFRCPIPGSLSVAGNQDPRRRLRAQGDFERGKAERPVGAGGTVTEGFWTGERESTAGGPSPSLVHVMTRRFCLTSGNGVEKSPERSARPGLGGIPIDGICFKCNKLRFKLEILDNDWIEQCLEFEDVAVTPNDESAGADIDGSRAASALQPIICPRLLMAFTTP